MAGKFNFKWVDFRPVTLTKKTPFSVSNFEAFTVYT